MSENKCKNYWNLIYDFMEVMDLVSFHFLKAVKVFFSRIKVRHGQFRFL